MRRNGWGDRKVAKMNEVSRGGHLENVRIAEPEGAFKVKLLKLCVLISSGCYDKMPSTCGLKPRYLFLTVLEEGKSKIKVVRMFLLPYRWPPSGCVLTQWTAEGL